MKKYARKPEMQSCTTSRKANIGMNTQNSVFHSTSIVVVGMLLTKSPSLSVEVGQKPFVKTPLVLVVLEE